MILVLSHPKVHILSAVSTHQSNKRFGDGVVELLKKAEEMFIFKRNLNEVVGCKC